MLPSLPKMHLLDDHTLEWARNWHAGFGLLGEQGAESIHARFYVLHRTFSSFLHQVNLPVFFLFIKVTSRGCHEDRYLLKYGDLLKRRSLLSGLVNKRQFLMECLYVVSLVQLWLVQSCLQELNKSNSGHHL